MLDTSTVASVPVEVNPSNVKSSPTVYPEPPSMMVTSLIWPEATTTFAVAWLPDTVAPVAATNFTL